LDPFITPYSGSDGLTELDGLIEALGELDALGDSEALGLPLAEGE
jgi:hypothetical protein